jgi:regulator of protease activity HflC (stomatin/prohibitin superfamily)
MKIQQVNTTISPVGGALCAGSAILGGVISILTRSPWPILLAALLAVYFLLSVRVADQWERVALLRLGRFQGMRGPGMFWIIPIIDSVSTAVDQRVRVGNVKAESTLTRDTVPVAVDAVYFWVVWNAEKAILEVEDFEEAIAMAAQTALRESIGRHELAQMITERESIGVELQRTLDEKTNPWGITIQSVEVRDVQIPQALEDAMSREAQAERERRARIIFGQAETEAAEKFVNAAKVYEGHPMALHLRAMNMLYETMKEKGAMVVVPSTAVETMGFGGQMGLASMARKDIV